MKLGGKKTKNEMEALVIAVAPGLYWLRDTLCCKWVASKELLNRRCTDRCYLGLLIKSSRGIIARNYIHIGGTW